MNKSAVVDWLVANWKFIAGPSAVLLAWKLAWKLSSGFIKIQLSMQENNRHIAKLATNDFPHVEQYLLSMSNSMEEMRKDFREFLMHSINKQ